MKDFIIILKDKIKTLRNEIQSIDYSSSDCNLKITKFEQNRILELRSKIQVLNQIIIEIEKPF
ncbi:hypothetical protein V3Q77_08390 [Flavobacterium davisii]|uniref:Uncharacterized protein n=1 Tax=Flavobacterium davisii TaxID=2906077 RepID=A0ABW8PPK0_9FLAO